MELHPARVAALDAVPGLVHGFGRRSDAAAESPEATRARVARDLARDGRLLLLRQVHGISVLEAPWTGTPDGDAAVVLAPAAGHILGIETADCLPLLLVDPRQRAAAAAHAGWRGTAQGVAKAAVEALLGRGSRAADLLAALGPSIGPCCYEVGEELRPSFAGEAAHVLRPGPNGRAHLDLRAANVRQLLAAGLEPAAIHHVNECTRCRKDLYHSYRGEGRGCGRMISFVGFRA